MKTKILLAFFCLLSISSLSQDSSFQIKDYKYRTPGFRALEFSTSFNGNLSDYKQGGSETQKSKAFQLTPSWISYSRIFSSDKRIHMSFVSLYPSFYSRNDGSGQEKSKHRNGQAALDWKIEDRFYKNNNWFLHLKNSFYTKGDFTRQSSAQQNIKTHIKGIDEELSIGFGKGRIEIVEDAQMALFIINDLGARGLIEKLPDAAAINQFAQLVTELNNQRVFDSRRKRIYQLTEIDKFLREKGIISTSDIRHFTTISDNWLFAFQPQRSSGHSWYFDIVSSAQIGKNGQLNEGINSKTDHENNYKHFGAGPKAGYINEKPVSLKWQRSLGAYLSWQLQRGEDHTKTIINGAVTENKENPKSKYSDLSAFYGFGYYPNNRTRLNTSIDLSVTHLKFHDLPSIDRQILVLPSISFSTDYFISYRTRLHANFSMNYRYREYKFFSQSSYCDRSFNASISAGISHFFL